VLRCTTQNAKKCTRLKLYIRIIFFVLGCGPNAYAVESVTFSVAKIIAADWVLEDAVLAITQLHLKSPQISLLSATVELPPPLDNITALDIHCKHFKWHENFLECLEGQGHFNSKQFKTLSFGFSLQVKNNKSTIKISDVPLYGGKFSLSAEEIEEKWQVRIKAQDVDLAKLKAVFAVDLLEISQGSADFEMELKGEYDIVQELLVTAHFKQVSAYNEEESIASEDVVLQTEFTALKQGAGWHWHNTSRFLAGGLYVDPVYLEADSKRPVTLTATGLWQQEQREIKVDWFKLEHPQTVVIQGNMILNHHAALGVELTDLSINIPQLQSAAPIYISPFLESSTYEGIEWGGAVDAKISISHNSVTEASVTIKNLTVDDTQKRFYIHNANAQINWSKQLVDAQASFINWQQLKIQTIPFQPGRLDFTSFDKQISLLQAADLSVLGGVLSINNFSFSMADGDTDAAVRFDGSIDTLSLEQLSKALGWTPLTGTISGDIPSVQYQDKTLSLDGELKIQVFDGEITIKNLASTGLFSNFPQLYTDIEFEYLDLDAITHQFHTGYIEGRLSGSMQNIYLENWRLVSFYAWLGTPEDDDSTHRISQKAIESIASIGGGGVSDLLSRSFLGIFSDFYYSKLGFGCYLHQGVCQLMGVEVVDNGFYLVKGGGLPRIDVIGYNPELDWGILVNRLSRITTSDEVIIK